jgi:hypothetical protein
MQPTLPSPKASNNIQTKYTLQPGVSTYTFFCHLFVTACAAHGYTLWMDQHVKPSNDAHKIEVLLPATRHIVSRKTESASIMLIESAREQRTPSK